MNDSLHNSVFNNEGSVNLLSTVLCTLQQAYVSALYLFMAFLDRTITTMGFCQYWGKHRFFNAHCATKKAFGWRLFNLTTDGEGNVRQRSIMQKDVNKVRLALTGME